MSSLSRRGRCDIQGLLRIRPHPDLPIDNDAAENALRGAGGKIAQRRSPPQVMPPCTWSVASPQLP